MPDQFSQFHFLQPQWLWLLPVGLLLVWLLRQLRNQHNPWQQVIDHQLYQYMFGKEVAGVSKVYLWLFVFAWLIAVLALANPVWEQRPSPIVQTQQARIIILDLSRSMLIEDQKPNRLARARFKIEDILRQQTEGQTGLIVFAGDTHVAVPLTRDVKTIQSMLPVLHPEIMPQQGSRVDLALKEAGNLFVQADVQKGHVVLFADGVANSQAEVEAVNLAAQGHRVSVIAMGTTEGGVIPDLQDRNGRGIHDSLDIRSLQMIAQQGDGSFSLLSTDQSDLGKVVFSHNTVQDNASAEKTEDATANHWQVTGPIWLFAVMPLALLAFRKGLLLGITALVLTIALPRENLYAADIGNETNKVQVAEQGKTLPAWRKHWNSLWQRPDQQAAQALNNKNYPAARQYAEQAKNPSQQGTAEYKQGNYEKAANTYSQTPSASNYYNTGNAYLKQHKYKEAIQAYDEALKLQNTLEDAVFNKQLAEKLQAQQDTQKKQQNQANNQQQHDKDPSGKQQHNQQHTQQDKQRQHDSEQAQNQQAQSQQDKQDTQQEEQAQSAPQQTDNQFADANKTLDQQQTESEKENQPDQEENRSQKTQQMTGQNQNQDPAGKAQQAQTAQQGQQQADQAKETANNIASTNAEQLSNEEKLAAEQWLRRIPDDPGGLLRRKFLQQYRQRGVRSTQGNPW